MRICPTLNLCGSALHFRQISASQMVTVQVIPFDSIVFVLWVDVDKHKKKQLSKFFSLATGPCWLRTRKAMDNIGVAPIQFMAKRSASTAKLWFVCANTHIHRSRAQASIRALRLDCCCIIALTSRAYRTEESGSMLHRVGAKPHSFSEM